jgi:hypothetical protein
MSAMSSRIPQTRTFKRRYQDELSEQEEAQCFSRRLPLACFLQRSDNSQGNLGKHEPVQKHHDDTTQTTATTATFITNESWDSKSERPVEATNSVHDYETEEEESLEEQSFEERTVDDNSWEEVTIDDESYEEYTVDSTVEDNKSLGSFFEELSLESDDYDLDYDIDDMDSLHDESFVRCRLQQAPLPPFVEDDENAEEDAEVEVSRQKSPDPEPVTMEQNAEGLRRAVSEEAAAFGRLTRLLEYTIESVSTEREEVETTWRSAGLLALDYQSIYRQVLEEAADKGARTKLPEKVVTTDDRMAMELDQVFREEDARPNVKELSALFGSAHFHTSIVFEGTMSVDKFLVKEKSHRNFSAKQKSKSSVIALPLPALPRIRGNSKTPQSIAGVAKEASVAAWDRQYRSRRGLRIRNGCECPYCATSSPHQTLAYQQQRAQSI